MPVAGGSKAERDKYLHCQKCLKKKEDLGGRALLKCARCKNAHYCSQACQKADWGAHKINCKLESDRLAALAFKPQDQQKFEIDFKEWRKKNARMVNHLIQAELKKTEVPQKLVLLTVDFDKTREYPFQIKKRELVPLMAYPGVIFNIENFNRFHAGQLEEGVVMTAALYLCVDGPHNRQTEAFSPMTVDLYACSPDPALSQRCVDAVNDGVENMLTCEGDEPAPEGYNLVMETGSQMGPGRAWPGQRDDVPPSCTIS